MAQRVKIHQRTEWQASFPKNVEHLKAKAQQVIIHHTATEASVNQVNDLKTIKNIQADHMNNKNYDDIGYNFLIGADGHIYEGRGWGVVGAHAMSHNHDSLGIAFLGNFNNSVPSATAITSAKKLLQTGVSLNHIVDGFELKGHRDVVETECPGTNLYSLLSQLK